MTLKLTKRQHEALYNLFVSLMQEKPKDIAGALMKELIQPIYIKLLKRQTAVMNGKSGWNLNLSAIEVKVYYTFFENMDISQKWHWESIIIQQHMVEIHERFTSNQF